MSGYRQEYTGEDQQRIVDYIVKTNDYYSLRGIVFWKNMEASGEFNGTWESLKEHFSKRIYPNLHLFKIDQNELKFIRAGYNPTQTKTEGIPKEQAFLYYTSSDSDSDSD